MKLCGFNVGLDQPFFLIAGPCVIESEQFAMDTAGKLKEMTSSLQIPFIYKSSLIRRIERLYTVIVDLAWKRVYVFCMKSKTGRCASTHGCT